MDGKRRNRRKIWEFILASLIIAVVLIHLYWLKEDGILNKKCPVDVSYPYDNMNQLDGDIPINTKLVIQKSIPSKMVLNNKGHYYFEFDDTFFGTIEIKLNEPVKEDTDLYVLMGEAIAPDKQSVWTRRDGMIDDAGWNVYYYRAAVTIPAGDDDLFIPLPERTRPTEKELPDGWKGGVLPIRCAEISAPYGIELKESNILRLAVCAPFNDQMSSFQSNNGTLNQVYDFCKRTIFATTYCGIYVDGYRECLPYEADAYINELSHFSLENENASAIAKDTLNVLLQNHTWPTEWIYHTIFAAREYYMYTGDLDYLESIYNDLQSCLLESLENQDGLIDSSLQNEELIDNLNCDSELKDIIVWPSNDRDDFDYKERIGLAEYLRLTISGLYYRYRCWFADLTGNKYSSWSYRSQEESAMYRRYTYKIGTPNAVVNAFYYKGLQDMAWIAKETGNMNDYYRYEEKAKRLKEVYQASFINKNGLVNDTIGSEHTSFPSNLFALCFGLVDDDRAVLAFLKSKGMAASTYSSQYFLETLCKYGETEYAIELMSSHSDRSWWYMENVIGSKLTTEFWNGRNNSSTDWSHAWSTAPLNIITRNIVGIRPKDAGCETIIFNPQFGQLDSIEAKVPVKNGAVYVLYSKENSGVEVKIVTPVNALYTIPDGVVNVMIDGKETTEDQWLTAGEHNITYNIDCELY